MSFNSSATIFGTGVAAHVSFLGTITVTASAAVNLNTAFVSVGTGNQATATVTTLNINSTWTDNAHMDIGEGQTSGIGANGQVFVNAGGVLSTSQMYIGGARSQAVGGTGSLTVQNGGKASVTGNWIDVGGQYATGTVTVTGAGSSLTDGGGFAVGNTGTGTLTVKNGGTLTAANLYVGVNYDNNTSASGTGTLNIQSGGVVTTTSGYQVIGSDAQNVTGQVSQGATGAAFVDGAGSKWNINNSGLWIGDAGSKTGSLTISNGGNVNSSDAWYIGQEWNGSDGSYGTLNITSGGTAVTGGTNWSILGATWSGSPASTATVTGAGSSWTLARLIVQGTSKLSVVAGGLVHLHSQLGFQGGVLQVDSNSTVEDGDAGGAALGFLTIDPDANYNANLWVDGTIEANLVNNGKAYSNEFNGGGQMVIEGPTGVAGTGTITGNGYFYVGTQSPLDLYAASVASSVHVQFAGWQTTLGIESTGFSAPIYNFNNGDSIDINGLTFNGPSSSYVFTPNGVNGGGTLTIHEGSGSVTLNIASAQQTITSTNLSLTADQSGTGTVVSFAGGATISPYHLWATGFSLFNNAQGPVNGEAYALGADTDGGLPIWLETESAYPNTPGVSATFNIVLSTSYWLGDVQPEITIATTTLIDPFASSLGVGNLAAPTMFSSTSTGGAGGIVYWTASTVTAGDYALNFEPFTVTYPANNPATPPVTLGASVQMNADIANPLSWTFGVATPTSLVMAYMTKATSTTENLYMQAFDNTGKATNSAPVLIASNLANNTPYYVGYDGNQNDSSYGYGYRYLAVNSSVGTGLVGGTFNTTTGAVGAPSLYLPLPQFTSFTGVYSHTLSNGNSFRLVEGVVNGQAVIESFVNKTSTPAATFNLTSADDHFQATNIYDPNTGDLDWIAVAYTDNNQVHLDLLNETGGRIGGDMILPGLTSFLRIHTLQGSTVQASTRVELDYLTSNPNGGQLVQASIYDTQVGPDQATITGGGLWDGSPYDDTFTWAAGVSTLDGGGGADTFVATSLSSSQVTITEDPSGEVIVNDGQGDVDTLRRFSTINLANATVAISGNTLTETLSSGAKTVSTYNITGQAYSTQVLSYDAAGEWFETQDYTSAGALTLQSYTTQIPNNFTGDDRSSVLFLTSNGGGSYSTWKLNDLSIVNGGGIIGAPGAAWTYEGSGDFFGDGYSTMLFRNQNSQIGMWRVQNGGYVNGYAVGNLGGTFNIMGVGDFNGDGYSDILFEDETGALVIWEMKGASILASASIGKISVGYSLVGIGDFNSDGKSDLLFENTSGNFVIFNMNGFSYTTASLAGPGAGWVYKGVGNFTGLGDSDLLFEYGSTDTFMTWDLTNNVKTGGGTLGQAAPDYKFAGIDNTTASGRSSILFENTNDGSLYAWDLNDTSFTGGGAIYSPGPSYAVIGPNPPLETTAPEASIVFVTTSGNSYGIWDVAAGQILNGAVLGTPSPGYVGVGVGDFNGDNQADILFANGSTYAVWETNGSSVTTGAIVSGASASGLTYKGVGDFNGDGRSDILFQNGSGAYVAWEMNGTTVGRVATLGAPSASGLTYAGAGDFTGDGVEDLLFTDASGNYWISFLNDNTIVATTKIGNPGAGLKLAAVGDLNGDGKADLLFNSASGALSSWDLSGASVVGGGAIGTPSSGFVVQGIQTFGAGAHASIVFENASTGQIAQWTMNDTQYTGGIISTAQGYNVLGMH